MAGPQVQLPTIKWADAGSPLSDAAGLFLAAQNAAAARRQHQEQLDEAARHALETEEYNRRVVGLSETSHADALKQLALQNKVNEQERNKKLVGEVSGLAEVDPAQAAALAAAGGGQLAPQDTASQIPEVATPPGADAVSMLLSQRSGAMTKPELREATGAAKEAAKAQYPGADLMHMSERDLQQPGMEPTNIEESLMLAAIGKNRTAEQDAVANASRERAKAVEAAKAADVGKYNLTLPGAAEPLPLIAGAQRMGKETVAQGQRELESERIGAMGDEIVASLHTGQESPTEMQQLGMLQADFKAIQGLVKSGALDVEKATQQLNAQIARRDTLGIWGARMATQENVAKLRPHPAGTPPKPAGTDELPLTREANKMIDTIARRNDYKPTINSYNLYKNTLADLNSGNDALIRRAIGMIGKEASGGSAVVTENELKRYVDEVGGKWQQLEKSWRTLIQTGGDTTGIPPEQIRIFSESMSRALIPRAESRLKAIAAMVDKSLGENPNVGLRKYRQNAIDQLLGGITPSQGAGGTDTGAGILGELGL